MTNPNPPDISWLSQSAIADLCIWAATQPELKLWFHKETGYSLDSIIGPTPLEAMIVQATGLDKFILNEWVEWVKTNPWEGTEEKRE